MNTQQPHQPAKKRKKPFSRQTILLVIFIVLLFGGGGYYFLTSFAPMGVGSTTQLEQSTQLPVKRVNWQKLIYENVLLKELRNPLTAPLEVGTVGHPNPFRLAPQKSATEQK